MQGMGIEMTEPPAASPASPTKFADGAAALVRDAAAGAASAAPALPLAQPNPRLNARGTRSLAPVPEPPAEGGGRHAFHVPRVREHPVMARAHPFPV
jgi:hypothetical protein